MSESLVARLGVSTFFLFCVKCNSFDRALSLEAYCSAPPRRASPTQKSMSNIGIPIKVLHDAEGHTVTVELKNGEVYRGKLDEAEDNMNVHLSNCTKTMKDGQVEMLSKCARARRPAAARASPLAPPRPTRPPARPQRLSARLARALHGPAGHPEKRALL